MWRHEKRTVSCSFCISVDKLIRGDSEREREAWASSLCILLSLESAHALPSTHIIAEVMELFLPPPLLVFSLSAPLLPPIHMFSRVLCHASFHSLCLPFPSLSSFVIHLNPNFSSPPLVLYLCPSIPPSYCLFWWREHSKNSSAPACRQAPALQQNSGDRIWGLNSFYYHCNVVC